MSPCSRCETLPSPASEGGLLYVAPPLTHTQASLRRMLKRDGIPFEEVVDGILTVELESGVLHHLGDKIGGSLSETELDDSRALVVEGGIDPSIKDLSRMQSLGRLLAAVRGEWLVEMMREGRLTTHFQPIVEAGNPDGEVFAYECLLRGLDVDGELVAPGAMFEVAEAAGLMFNLDRDARIMAIRRAAEYGIESNIFINFNPTSIYDPAYCLQGMMKAFENTKLRSEQVVFEITEGQRVKDVRHLLNIIDFYRDAGFRIALDDLGAGYSSLSLLNKLRPDFVKLDIELVRNVGTDPYGTQVAAKILELAKSLGVAVVAEGVESEEEWHWLDEHGADYLQGFLFARPASPPPETSRLSSAGDT
ncbi:MAG: EAL domain-containing protein [Rubrobacteraceae bacterium]